MFTIYLAKEPFKFSCSHFTVLSENTAERLHGHNYQLRMDVDVKDIDPNMGFAFDFNLIKPLIKAFCDRLDERILLPSKSKFVEVKKIGNEIEARFMNKRYLFPQEDVYILPLTNMTCEELARYACNEFVLQMNKLPGWVSLHIHIEETRGQSVSYVHQR